MSKLTPGQEGESAGAEWARLPPVDGPKWTSDQRYFWNGSLASSKSPRRDSLRGITPVRPGPAAWRPRVAGVAAATGKAVPVRWRRAAGGRDDEPGGGTGRGQLTAAPPEAARRKRQVRLRGGTRLPVRTHLPVSTAPAVGWLLPPGSAGGAGLVGPAPGHWNRRRCWGRLAGGALSAWIGSVSTVWESDQWRI
jgi:hypothetical protein